MGDQACGCLPPHRCVCEAEKRARQVLAQVVETALDELRVNKDPAAAQERLEGAQALAQRILRVDGAPPEDWQTIGSRGGRKTLNRHGPDHYRAAGQKSGMARRDRRGDKGASPA